MTDRPMTSPNNVTVRILRVGEHSTWPLPRYETDDAAGMDLRAAMAEPVKLAPGDHTFVPTGLALEIPRGYEGQVRPRSGLARKFGLTVLNAPGTIDADYRGEVAVLLINLGRKEVALVPGERIAQLIIAPVTRATLVETESLETTERGAGGFGHTGR